MIICIFSFLLSNCSGLCLQCSAGPWSCRSTRCSGRWRCRSRAFWFGRTSSRHWRWCPLQCRCRAAGPRSRPGRQSEGGLTIPHISLFWLWGANRRWHWDFWRAGVVPLTGEALLCLSPTKVSFLHYTCVPVSACVQDWIISTSKHWQRMYVGLCESLKV